MLYKIEPTDQGPEKVRFSIHDLSEVHSALAQKTCWRAWKQGFYEGQRILAEATGLETATNLRVPLCPADAVEAVQTAAREGDAAKVVLLLDNLQQMGQEAFRIRVRKAIGASDFLGF